MNKNKSVTLWGGFLIGFVNSIFGAGGGIIAVPLLKKADLTEKQSHSNAVAVILPITVFSAVAYMLKGSVTLGDALPFIPTGLIGAVIGTVLLKKISPKALKRVFGIFIIYAGIRLLLR